MLLVVKNPLANAAEVDWMPGSGRSPGEEGWQPTPVFLPGESQGQRSLAGYSPRVHKRVGQELVTKQQQMRQKVEDFSGGYIVPRVGGETRLSVIQLPN